MRSNRDVGVTRVTVHSQNKRKRPAQSQWVPKLVGCWWRRFKVRDAVVSIKEVCCLRPENRSFIGKFRCLLSYTSPRGIQARP